MKAAVTGVLLLLALAAMPVAARAAKPAPKWPTAHDLLQQKGVRTADAVCMARYYRGRLTRKAWFTQYYDLTPAEKRVTDDGVSHCLSQKQRIAFSERYFTFIVGQDSPQVHCVAAGSEALTRAQRDAITSRPLWVRAYDRIFRTCRMTGVLYAGIASANHLKLTPSERACTNRVGSIDPVLYPRFAKTRKAHFVAFGKVFDRCVGLGSEAGMYRYVLRKFLFSSKIPCIARRTAATVTFVEFLTADAREKALLQKATSACLSGAPTI